MINYIFDPLKISFGQRTSVWTENQRLKTRGSLKNVTENQFLDREPAFGQRTSFRTENQFSDREPAGIPHDVTSWRHIMTSHHDVTSWRRAGLCSSLFSPVLAYIVPFFSRPGLYSGLYRNKVQWRCIKVVAKCNLNATLMQRCCNVVLRLPRSCSCNLHTTLMQRWCNVVSRLPQSCPCNLHTTLIQRCCKVVLR